MHNRTTACRVQLESSHSRVCLGLCSNGADSRWHRCLGELMLFLNIYIYIYVVFPYKSANLSQNISDIIP